MRHFTADDLSNFETRYRNYLINSLSGYKSANLIGTQNASGQTNLAVFNSVVHLGSNPALLGFILRPTTVQRHSFSNMQNTGYFSVNHIGQDMIEAAHHTSAKYPETVSEFEKTGLQPVYKTDQKVPFVEGSPVQILCRYVNNYLIEENNTRLVVGAIEEVFVQEEMLHPDGWLQLDKGNVVAINGLEGYAKTELIDRFPYARPKE